MKMYSSKRLAIALALFAAPFLTGCGSGSGSGALPPGYGGVVPGSTSAIGCVGLTTPIGMQINGMSVDYSGNFVAGTLPLGGMSAGSVVMTGATNPIGGQTYGSQGVSGTIQMQIGNAYGYNPYQQQYPYQQYPQQYPQQYGVGGYATGMIQISQIMAQQIAMSVQSMPGIYPTQYPGQYPYQQYPGMGYGQPCISGIAMRGSIYPNVGGMRAEVYLYMNNTNHGYGPVHANANDPRCRRRGNLYSEQHHRRLIAKPRSP